MRRAAATFVHLLLGAVLLYAAFRFSLKIFYFLRSPWSRDYGEGAVLAMVQVLRTEGTYFTSLRDYPLVTGNYPPVFVGLVALGVPPNIEEMGRALVVLIVTIAYAGVWLALAMLFSIVFRSAATAALASLGLWLFMTILWPLFSPVLANAFTSASDVLGVL